MSKKNTRFPNPRKNLIMIIDLLGAIAVWWGIWGILDLFFFPENRFFSYLVSIVFGLLLLLFSGNGLDDFK